MSPRTPLRRPSEYFEDRGFDLGPAAAAVGVALSVLVVAIVAFGVLFAGRLRGAGHPDAASTLWGVLVGQLFGLVFLTLLGWLFVTVVLHLVSRAALSHEGRFGQTLAVTGWGFAPTVVATVVTFPMLAFALQDASLSSPAAFVEQFQANVAATGIVRGVVGFAATCWQTYIYAHGLAVEFDSHVGTAGIVGGVVAFGFWFLSLV